MAKLLYTAIASLDGYVADESGNWDWSIPSDEVHAFINDAGRGIGTYLVGRRMYEVLVPWEDFESFEDQRPVMRDFADVWRNADKVVYSRTLDKPSSARTRIERTFDPDAVRELKADADRELEIGGPELAAQAIAAGLVDEIRLYLSPVIVGGGKPALPAGLGVDLDLLDERRFGNGVVHLRYAVRTPLTSS
jgi:dihydrofolate reductase